MPLNKDQLAMVTEAINKKIGDAKCPLCGNPGWSIAPDLSLIGMRYGLEQQAWPAAVGGYGLPTIAITCTNCGNTHQLHLHRLGFDEFLKPVK